MLSNYRKSVVKMQVNLCKSTKIFRSERKLNLPQRNLCHVIKCDIIEGFSWT